MHAFAFFPLFVDEKYPEMSSFWAGVFLAAPDLAIVLLGIPIGELIIRKGRTRSIRFSHFIVLLTSVFMAFLSLIEHNEHVFFWTSLFFRFCFGLGYTGIFIVGFATIASNYGDNAGKYNGYGEGLCGLGLFVGPILGGYFFNRFGFFEA